MKNLSMTYEIFKSNPSLAVAEMRKTGWPLHVDCQADELIITIRRKHASNAPLYNEYSGEQLSF